ncbi:MAG TPA: hypothetical protein VHO69_17400 [Phototrophicaceae bacterium]|nr:hypothetical protein [Phototrophicaceae bacterium]
MPIEVSWANDHQPILLYRLQDPWGWDDFYTATDQGRSLREGSGVQMIHIIIDMTAVRQLPQGTLTHMGSMFRYGAPSTTNIQYVVFVGASRLVHSVMQLLGKVNQAVNQKVQFAPSITEALTLIEEIPQYQPRQRRKPGLRR